MSDLKYSVSVIHMSIEQQFSKEDLRNIGIRLHAARVLTGMRREEFAEKQDVSVTSIKNWELGRVLPRHDKIVSVLNTLKACGIFASQEWILYGNGLSPNYQSPELTQAFTPENAHNNEFIDEQIKLFLKAQRAKGFTPVVVSVSDNAMAPTYHKGDHVGAVLVSHEYVKGALANNHTTWLVTTTMGTFAPANLFFLGDRWFFNTAQRTELRELSSPSIAKILWHYSPELAL